MKKAKFFIVILLATGIFSVSCKKEKTEPAKQDERNLDELRLLYGDADTIILGKKLTMPYSVEIMTKAYNNLYPGVLAKGELLKPNMIYVKFKPASVDEYIILVDNTDLELFTYPLDYEIIGQGSYYKDPEVTIQGITYLYCVSEIDKVLPDVKYDVIEQIYMPSDQESELENEAWRIADEIGDAM